MTALRTLMLIMIMFFAVPVHARDSLLPSCYTADVKHVIDGDTIKAFLYVWQGLNKTISVRIADIYAPELEDPKGPAAKEYLETIAGKRVSVCHIRCGKYCGRVVADVFTQGGDDIAKMLVAAGYARRAGK